jgi:hypothetical protein
VMIRPPLISTDMRFPFLARAAGSGGVVTRRRVRSLT